MKEFLIGFDIRHPIDEIEIADRIVRHFPHVEEPRAMDTRIWPSMFRSPLPSDLPADPVQTNFHQQRNDSSDGRLPVYGDYARKFIYCKLWENLGNMLLRYPFDFDDEEVAAFTIFRFDEPKIYAYGDVNFHDRVDIFESTYWNTRYEYYKDLVTPTALNKEEWRFLGYDSSAQSGILHMDAEELSWHGITARRNRYGLLDDFATALQECVILNDKDRDHDAYLIIGVYQAIDRENLSFV
jgi:hypothetical protein